jgi:hypothetical protein
MPSRNGTRRNRSQELRSAIPYSVPALDPRTLESPPHLQRPRSPATFP